MASADTERAALIPRGLQKNQDWVKEAMDEMQKCAGGVHL